MAIDLAIGCKEATRCCFTNNFKKIKDMNVMETMGDNVALVKDWFESLDEKAKETTTVYMIIGDMEGKCNVDFIAGHNIENLVLTLAQSMVNDEDFYRVAKAAVELVAKFNEIQEEELKEIAENMKSNIVS